MLGWIESELISFFAGAALKSVVILAAAWLIVFILRKRSAGVRHIVWTAASAALLALPFLSISLPVLPVIETPGLITPAFEVTATATAAGSVSQVRSQATPVVSTASHSWRPNWGVLLAALWFAGTALCFARMASAWISIRRMRRRARPLKIADFPAKLELLGIRCHVDTFETAPGSMPMSCGLLRPAVFLPQDASEWPAQRRRLVVLHELAHIRRGDFAAHLLTRVALSFYWWNPLAWNAWREALKERERAADDVVLNAGAQPAEYADQLLDIARTMQSPRQAAWATVAFARRSQLEGRLLAILDAGTNRKSPRRASAWLAAVLAVALVAPLAALRAQENPPDTLPADLDATIRTAVAQRNHEMLERAAKAAEAQQKLDVAQTLLEKSLAVRADVSGKQSVDYGVGLLKLGALEDRRGNSAAALGFYTQAADVLGNRPEAATALLYLGINAIREKNLDNANGYFEKAKLADPSKGPNATMWMAIVQERLQNNEQADWLYRQAVAISDPASPDATTIMSVYARFLESQGRSEDAKPLVDQAKAIRKAQTDRERVLTKAAAGANVYTIGPGVTPPAPLTRIDPEYTYAARAAKLSGSVVVYVEIGADGFAHNPTVLSGIGMGLDENAIAAIRQWTFKPAMKDGQPVTVGVTIEVNFRLL